MATFTKRIGKRGVRWTARVRLRGRVKTETFGSKAAADAWARAEEGAIETGHFKAAVPGAALILADAIDKLREERERLRRPPGATFGNALDRLKRELGLEPASAIDWLEYAKGRIAGGVTGSTVAGDLAYAGSILKLAAQTDRSIDPQAAARARTELSDAGVTVKSKERTGRVNDAQLKALFRWIDANAERTSLPLHDLVEFALATGMRRGEILALRWDDIDGRVATIKRKHPKERDRVERVPLLKKNAKWPRVDPLTIIKRQPKTGPRIFPYLGDTLGFWFEQACAGARLKNIVFHTLRHECLSRLAQRGFDPLRLALVGGHRDLRNVKRYAKLDPEALANE